MSTPASCMPQAVAMGCGALVNEVRYLCYPGVDDLAAELSQDTDVLFIGAFTRSAQTAYALSNLGRRGGAVTVLGGPHARCYPQDAAKYFDYVLGRSEENTSELQSLMRISYAVFCLKKKKANTKVRK